MIKIGWKQDDVAVLRLISLSFGASSDMQVLRWSTELQPAFRLRLGVADYFSQLDAENAAQPTIWMNMRSFMPLIL